MNTNFNENYFWDPDDDKKNEKFPEFDYEIYGKYVERISGDWEIISVDSEDI